MDTRDSHMSGRRYCLRLVVWAYQMAEVEPLCHQRLSSQASLRTLRVRYCIMYSRCVWLKVRPHWQQTLVKCFCDMPWERVWPVFLMSLAVFLTVSCQCGRTLLIYQYSCEFSDEILSWYSGSQQFCPDPKLQFDSLLTSHCSTPSSLPQKWNNDLFSKIGGCATYQDRTFESDSTSWHYVQ